MVGAARRTPPRLQSDPNRAPTACDRVAKLFCVSDFGNCARALTRPNLTPYALGRLAIRRRIEFVGDCGTLGARCESPGARTGVEGSNPRRGARSRTHYIHRGVGAIIERRRHSRRRPSGAVLQLAAGTRFASSLLGKQGAAVQGQGLARTRNAACAAAEFANWRIAILRVIRLAN